MDYLNNLENNFKGICNDCDYEGTEKCNYRKCNIGFANYVVKNIKNNAIQSIEDGESLIPKDDFKYYDEKIIARSISNVCRLCKECSGNHSENCVIALIRRTLEYTQLKDRIEYPGNIINYLSIISKQKPELAKLINEEYMRIG